MEDQRKNTAYILAFTFIAAIAFIYLLISIALIPYWQGLSGNEIQAWWSGPFTRFSYLMVPIHLLSIGIGIYAYALNRKEKRPFNFLWLFALITLLICQAFNFGLHGSIYNPALQSGTLEASEALEVFDNWSFYHHIRTASIAMSMLVLIAIGIRSRAVR
ncbi:MAG: DUF1772 domain-containing protein [Saprospiraceae bacterium]|nr:DUF1772 domain-containing protein [Saprospiraceae bacterium]